MDYPNSIETEKELAIRLHQFFTSVRMIVNIWVLNKFKPKSLQETMSTSQRIVPAAAHHPLGSGSAMFLVGEDLG